MEKALWDGQLYTTIEISDSYELEKAIRQASGRKELVCPDLDCPNPILRIALVEVAGDGEFCFFYRGKESFFRSSRISAIFHHRYLIEIDVAFCIIELCSGIAQRSDDPAPVRIISEPCTFTEH